MKKLRVYAILFMILIILGKAGAETTSYIPRPDGLYDNNNFFVDPEQNGMEKAIGAVAEIFVEAVYQGAGETELKKMANGTGVVVGKGYVLTLAHVLSTPDFYVRSFDPTRPGLWPKKHEEFFLVKNGQKYVLGMVFLDKENDIALLRLPDDSVLKPFPYPFGNSDDLMLGNMIYVIGSPLKLGINVREAIVSSFYPPEIISKTGVKRENVFMISRASSPGDSGSPVVAIRDGRYEIVGLLQGFAGEKEGDKVRGVISYALKINFIKKVLQENLAPEIFEKLGF